jgi:hypothetical protein
VRVGEGSQGHPPAARIQFVFQGESQSESG